MGGAETLGVGTRYSTRNVGVPFRCAELLQLLGTRRSFLPRLRHQDFMSNLTLKRKNSGI